MKYLEWFIISWSTFLCGNSLYEQQYSIALWQGLFLLIFSIQKLSNDTKDRLIKSQEQLIKAQSKIIENEPYNYCKP